MNIDETLQVDKVLTILILHYTTPIIHPTGYKYTRNSI